MALVGEKINAMRSPAPFRGNFATHELSRPLMHAFGHKFDDLITLFTIFFSGIHEQENIFLYHQYRQIRSADSL